MNLRQFALQNLSVLAQPIEVPNKFPITGEFAENVFTLSTARKILSDEA